MGMGVAKGTNRAMEAAKEAIASPLLEESSIEGAKGLLLNISGGVDLSLHEVDEASTIAKEAADPQANIIVGHVIDPGLEDEVIITVIATGFEQQQDSLRTKPAMNPGAQERARLPVPPIPQPVLSMAGTASMDGSAEDLDRPAFMRRGESDARVEQGNLLVDADWEVPTFLRRRAN